MPTLTLSDALAAVLERCPQACVVSSCGYPSREVFNSGDRSANFYLVGSMGMAAPIALGVALSKTDRQVIAIDGDGSLLMNLSVLPMVAAGAANLVHLVADNGVHESTGGQPTVCRCDFVALALAAGYRKALLLSRPDQLEATDLAAGPVLIQVMTGPRESIGARVEPEPHELVRRFRHELNSSRPRAGSPGSKPRPHPRRNP